MTNTQISIIGCGWLGFPLAQKFSKSGFMVKGSTTSVGKISKLKNSGIIPFLIHLHETKIEGRISEFLDQSETLIINIPPGLRKHPDKNHVMEIAQLIPHIEKSTIKNVLFISSTSVFKDDIDFPKITESTMPDNSSKASKQLIAIEHLLQNNSKFNTTILRFSGLFGADRHPGEFLSGRNDISNSEAPINLIHQLDCIEIIQKIIQKKLWNTAFNAAFPFHPKKEDYYVSYCRSNNLELPEFSKDSISKGKTINSTNLAQLLEYEYKHKP